MERPSLGRGEILNGPGTVLYLFRGYAKASDGGAEDEVLSRTTGPEEGKEGQNIIQGRESEAVRRK